MVDFANLQFSQTYRRKFVWPTCFAHNVLGFGRSEPFFLALDSPDSWLSNAKKIAFIDFIVENRSFLRWIALNRGYPTSKRTILYESYEERFSTKVMKNDQKERFSTKI